ncbi:MAG TPA: universal stress protein [Labilithrix sp.]
MIARILVALDASPRAAGVLWTAAEIARRFDAAVHPLRVVFVPPEFPPSAHVAHGDPLPDHLMRGAEEELRHLVASAADLRLMAPMVRRGQPWRVILAVAEEIDANLVVIGSHGYHGIDRLLGTTASKVANLATRDVLVVHNRVDPPNSSSLLGGDESTGPYR